MSGIKQFYYHYWLDTGAGPLIAFTAIGCLYGYQAGKVEMSKEQFRKKYDVEPPFIWFGIELKGYLANEETMGSLLGGFLGLVRAYIPVCAHALAHALPHALAHALANTCARSRVHVRAHAVSTSE